jgi:hypothetical protein
VSELVQPAAARAPTPSDVPATTSLTFPRQPVRALVHAWLILDFFADSRRSGQPSSSLTTTIFGQAFLGLVFAALLFPDTAAGAFAAANLSLSTLLVGIGHLSDDRGAGRARADRVLVATSPLSVAAILLARVLYSGFYVCLLTIGMALPPAVLCVFLAGQGLASVPLYLVLACVCSGLFTAALAIVLRGFERAFGPARAQLASGTVKALLLFAGLVAFAVCARRLDGGAAGLPIPTVLLQAWPPFHAGRVIAGDASGALLLLAALALLGLAVLPLSRETEGRSVAGVGAARVLARLDRGLARGDPPLHAVTAFTSAMLYRSAAFRGRVLPLFGMPAGMWLLAFLDHDPTTVQRLHAVAAQLPGVYLPFLVGFLATGDEPRARWLFASCPHLPGATIQRGIAIALATHVLLPVHVLLFAVGIPTVGWLRAIATSTLAFGLAVLVGRFVLRKVDDVPFSASGAEGSFDFGGLLGIALLLTVVGLGAASLSLPMALALGGAVLAAALVSLQRTGVAPPAAGPASRPESLEPQPAAPAQAPSPAPQPPSLRRELRAIATLYVVISVLPLALGWLLAR